MDVHTQLLLFALLQNFKENTCILSLEANHSAKRLQWGCDD